MIDLERQFRAALGRLEMISHGATQAWNSDGRGGFERDFPPGEPYPPHLHFRWLWGEQTSDDGRLSVIAAADDLWQTITGRNSSDRPRQASLSEEEIRRLMVLDCNGMTPQEVRTRNPSLTVKQVRDIRLDENREPERGDKLNTSSRAAWAASLAAQGLSQEKIADRMGISQPTVHRLLKAEALRRHASAA